MGRPVVVLVVVLYSDSNPICAKFNQVIDVVAKRNGNIKFCKGIARSSVANLPDSQTPSVLVYKNGDCVKQLFGTAIWILDGNLTPESVEHVLKREAKINIFTESQPDEDGDHDDDDDHHDDRCYGSLKMEQMIRLK